MSWFTANAAVTDAKQRQKEWHREAQMQHMVREASQAKADSIAKNSRERRSIRHLIGRLFKKCPPILSIDPLEPEAMKRV
jgi:hypothetical protein